MSTLFFFSFYWNTQLIRRKSIKLSQKLLVDQLIWIVFLLFSFSFYSNNQNLLYEKMWRQSMLIRQNSLKSIESGSCCHFLLGFFTETWFPIIYCEYVWILMLIHLLFDNICDITCNSLNTVFPWHLFYPSRKIYVICYNGRFWLSNILTRSQHQCTTIFIQIIKIQCEKVNNSKIQMTKQYIDTVTDIVLVLTRYHSSLNYN